MYLLGVVAGAPIGIGKYLLGQLLVSLAQITAHYLNEYSDVEADRLVTNRTFFSGGSGVLVESGAPSWALHLAWITTSATVAVAISVAFVSVPAALLGLLALGVSWAYSMPPMRWLDSGLGELATSVVVTVVVPLIGIMMTGASPNVALLQASAVLLPIHLAMMLVFEIPDAMTDRIAGKTVIAVRIGEPRTQVLIFVMYLVSAGCALLATPGYGRSAFGFGAVVFVMIAGVFYTLGRRAFGWATSLAVAILVVVGLGYLRLFLAS